jgi:exodeoxyribonuclease VII small subunit
LEIELSGGIDAQAQAVKIIIEMGEEKKTRKFKFEQAITDLESIVGRMDSGELGLEDMLKEFERGVKLVRDCQQFLKQAQRKVEKLIAEQGDLEIEELDMESGRGEDKVD